MATYQDQFKSAFDTNMAAWKSSKQIYDAMKSKLAGNTAALSALDTHYNNLMPPTPITGPVTLPKTGTVPIETFNAKISSQTPTQTAGTGASNIVAPKPAVTNPIVVREVNPANSFDSQIKNSFATNTASGKTPQQIYDAMKVKLASNPTALAALESHYATLQPTAGNMAGRKNIPGSSTKAPVATPNKSGASVNTAGMDTDTASAVTSQVKTINQEYDDKIKTHDAYAKTITDALDKNQVEFGGKYQEMRNNVSAMEKEMLGNYAQLKTMIADNYATGMDSYTRNAAAAQAGISGTLSQSGISGAALNNALAEAQYDPKRLAAIQSLKDKQITDVTNLEQNYNNWYNNIVANKSSLTAAEQQLADSVLQRKDQLSTELNDLKTKNLTDAYKPITDVQSQKVDALAKGETINAQQNKTINDYAAASPARKKDMLMYNLQTSGAHVGDIDEKLLNDALSHGSYPDALAFLRNEADKRAEANQIKMMEAQYAARGKKGTTTDSTSGNLNDPSTSTTWTGPTTWAGPLANATSKQLEEIRAIQMTKPGMTEEKVDAMMKKAWASDIAITNSKDITTSTGTTSTGTTSTDTSTDTSTGTTSTDTTSTGSKVMTQATGAAKKNIPTTALWYAIAAGEGAVEWQLVKSGAKFLAKWTPEMIQKAPEKAKAWLARMFAASIGALWDMEKEAQAIKFAEWLMKSGISWEQLLTEGDTFLRNAAKEGLAKAGPGLAGKTRDLLIKVSQYGSKAIPIIDGLWAIGKAAFRFLPAIGMAYQVADEFLSQPDYSTAQDNPGRNSAIEQSMKEWKTREEAEAFYDITHSL